jgi:hypothetical protein
VLAQSSNSVGLSMEVERCLDSLHRVTGKREGGALPNHSSGTGGFSQPSLIRHSKGNSKEPRLARGVRDGKGKQSKAKLTRFLVGGN